MTTATSSEAEQQQRHRPKSTKSLSLSSLYVLSPARDSEEEKDLSSASALVDCSTAQTSLSPQSTPTMTPSSTPWEEEEWKEEKGKEEAFLYDASQSVPPSRDGVCGSVRGGGTAMRNSSDNTTAMASDSESTNPYHSDEESMVVQDDDTPRPSSSPPHLPQQGLLSLSRETQLNPSSDEEEELPQPLEGAASSGVHVRVVGMTRQSSPLLQREEAWESQQPEQQQQSEQSPVIVSNENLVPPNQPTETPPKTDPVARSPQQEQKQDPPIQPTETPPKTDPVVRSQPQQQEQHPPNQPAETPPKTESVVRSQPEQQQEPKQHPNEQSPPIYGNEKVVHSNKTETPSRKKRLVRSFSQEPVKDRPRGRQRNESQGKGLFGRSSTPLPPPTRTGPSRTTALSQTKSSSALTKDCSKDEKEARRSWLGSFRGKPVMGKPEALVVVAPETRSSSRSRGIDDNEDNKRNDDHDSEVESATSHTSHRSPTWGGGGGRRRGRGRPPLRSNSVPRKAAATATTKDLSALQQKPTHYFAMTKIIQSLTKDSTAEMTEETADKALRELRTLQAELVKLSKEKSAIMDSNALNNSRTEHLQLELAAAQNAATHLEALNKSYRKKHKQMLLDLHEAQSELETYRDSNPDSDEAQLLAEELAATMAELLALREEHQALLSRTSSKHSNKIISRSSSSGVETQPLEDISDDAAVLKEQAMLNLQKDLSEAMATISLLEENNELLRKHLRKQEIIGERLRSDQVERDELAAQLNDQRSAQSLGHVGTDASPQDRVSLVTIERLQREKKQMLAKEHVLKEKIKMLEIKNKNQKTIFETAVEIKQVELKINQKERDILSSQLVEIRKERLVEGNARSEELELLQARLQAAEEQQHKAESAEKGDGTAADESQQQLLSQEIETKKLEIETLENMLKEQERESKARYDEMVADMNSRIHDLDEKLKTKESELSELEERARLEAFKARRMMEEKVGELQEQLDEYMDCLVTRDEQIKKLEDDVRERRAEIERIRSQQLQQSLRARSVSGGRAMTDRPKSGGRTMTDRPKSGERSERLNLLRDRMGNYESLMRSKVENIRKLDSNSSETSGNALSSLTNSIVVPSSASVPDELRRQQPESSQLKSSEAQIAELQTELANARKKLEEARTEITAEQEIRKREQSAAELKARGRIQELLDSLKESEHRVADLKEKLEETNSELAQVQAEASAARSLDGGDQVMIEKEALIGLLAEKEETCSGLEKQIEELGREKASADEKCKSAYASQRETQSKLEDMETELLRVQQQASSEVENEPTPNSEDDRIRSLEQELSSTVAQLAEAESKCEMLEQFIQEDTHTALQSGASSGDLADVVALREALQEKKQEVERLSLSAETSKEQLSQARRNVEELESERTQNQAKLSQLSAIVEKRGDSETDEQLRLKCLEAASATAAKEELSEKLRAANAVIKRLEAELDANNGPEDRSVSSATTQLNMRLAETEVKLDVLRGKLSDAEKTMRELRQQNEKLDKQCRDGTSPPEEVITRMKFLEEQNAAYAASLRGLRIEIATRHEGTAFE